MIDALQESSLIFKTREIKIAVIRGNILEQHNRFERMNITVKNRNIGVSFQVDCL